MENNSTIRPQIQPAEMDLLKILAGSTERCLENIEAFSTILNCIPENNATEAQTWARHCLTDVIHQLSKIGQEHHLKGQS